MPEQVPPLRSATSAAYPQFTQIFGATAPLLRSGLAVFQTIDQAEVIRVSAPGPNLYITGVTCPVGVEVAFDDSGSGWQPARPGLGWKGQNFSTLYFRRTSFGVINDSIEYFSGSAELVNYQAVTRPASRRSITTTAHFPEGIISLANSKREKITLTGLFPILDVNSSFFIGFGTTLLEAKENAMILFSHAENDAQNGNVNQTSIYQGGGAYVNTFTGKNYEIPGFFGSLGTGAFAGSPQSDHRSCLEIVITHTQDVYMACYDSANDTFGFPTFANTPSFLRVTETIYD